MRFRTQPNHYTCGALALINCMIALKQKPLSLELVKGICNNGTHGTWVNDLRIGFKGLGYSFQKVNRRTNPEGVYVLLIWTPEDPKIQHYVVSTAKGIHNNYDYKTDRYTKCSKSLMKNEKIVSMYEVF